ncbi:MAG TPA: glycosyltransferase family 4 protein [Jatrophihabitans sp.]|jgi:glycosyltransferase involved in cell wall biosynthesis|uniref:glycosyltransferase family 4 protein n=1 Tax=Jatrophihabitans sp. TaxID=1932789 RepID=UPI002EE48804
MRIAHVTDCYLPRLGGIERQVQGLATAQLAAGHQVTVITSVPADAPPAPRGTTRARTRAQSRMAQPARSGTAHTAQPGTAEPAQTEPAQTEPAQTEPAELRVIRPAGPGGRPGSIRYLTSLRGRQAVLDGGYDLVHVHASTFSPLAYLAAGAASRSGVATVATLHSLWSYATPIFRGFDVALDWRAWPITWTAVSTAAATSLAQVLRPGTEISVLANGISPERWQQTRRPPDPQRVVIVSVMRLAARKRPLQLLRVLREVRAQVPAGIGIEVQIIGAGPQRETMLSYLRRHRMTGWVELTGQLDQPAIRDRFADADLYVSPATLESFGIAALEARCAGLPVLAFAGTGVSDFIEHGRNGLLVRSDDQLTTALAKLAQSPAARVELAGDQPSGDQRGDEFGYTWDHLLQTCEQVYRRAFEQVSKPMPPNPVPGSLPAAGPPSVPGSLPVLRHP